MKDCEFKTTLEDLVSSIVYYSGDNDEEYDIESVYKDLRTLRNLKTLKFSSNPDAIHVRNELDAFISLYKKIFKSKRFILEIDGGMDVSTDEFWICIGDDAVFAEYECFQEALDAGVITIDRKECTARIYGADLVKYRVATISEILWNMLWSGICCIDIIDTKTGKKSNTPW